MGNNTARLASVITLESGLLNPYINNVIIFNVIEFGVFKLDFKYLLSEIYKKLLVTVLVHYIY